MTDKEIILLATKMVIQSTDIILQSTDGVDTFVFKLHKLKIPNVRISLHLNQEIQFDKEIEIDEAFPILCDAVKFSLN